MLLRPKSRRGGADRFRVGAAAAESVDQLLHPASERFGAQLRPQGAVEQGLPELAVGQRLAAAVDGLAAVPGPQQIGPVEGVVVEGIGDGPPQLPVAQFQRLSGPPVRQPAPQGLGVGFGGDRRQQAEQGPDEPVGAPGIDSPRWGPGSLSGGGQQLIDQLAQMAAGEGKAQVGGDAAEVLSQLFPEPAAGGPGVDHHLDLLERVGRVETELGGQQAGQNFGPVAAKDRQQGGGLSGPGSVPSRGTGPSTGGLARAGRWRAATASFRGSRR